MSINAENTTMENDKDETSKPSYNEIYNAIYSGSKNIELLGKLVSKWSGNHTEIHYREYFSVLSQVYEDLKLKNVPMSEYTKIFVEVWLINLRLSYNTPEQGHDEVDYLGNLKERVQLVFQSINVLKTDNSKGQNVDEKFLYMVKFIAQNIHILKKQLKSTYDKIPWEEMEFCLVCFWCSYMKKQEVNLFYHFTFNKDKILTYLKNFEIALKEVENILNDVDDISKFSDLPKLQREVVVAEITNNYPHFEEFYKDYERVKDMNQLVKISDFIKSALSANPRKKEGRLIIIRVLGVIGECFKNTLEAPNLSRIISKHLALTLPRDTRYVILQLSNSPSHIISLYKRTNIEENKNDDFFINAQKHIERINKVITDFLNKNKIKIIRMFLKKITSIESQEEVREIAEIFRNCKLDKLNAESFKAMMEHDQLEILVKELNEYIIGKTNCEKLLFDEINKILSGNKKPIIFDVDNYITAFMSFNGICFIMTDNNFNQNAIRTAKHFADKILDITAPSQGIHDIGELSMLISRSAVTRIEDNSNDVINGLICEICFITECEVSNLELLDKLRGKSNFKGSVPPSHTWMNTYDKSEDEHNEQLELKLSELKNILMKNRVSENLNEHIFCYKRNKQLLLVIEILLLDILTILEYSLDRLGNNHFLYEYSPLLTGKCLLNYLAHDNALLNILLIDPSIAVIWNAENHVLEDWINSTKKIGEVVDDISNFKNRHEQSLTILKNQKEMITAIKKKKLKELESVISSGADINAVSISSWSVLHYAARSNFQVVRYFLGKNVNIKTKDVTGKSPLHIAAAYGRKKIVKIFIKEFGISVDVFDNNHKTPLHFAALNGHTETVEVLLKHNARTNIIDTAECLPIHYAIGNGHTDIVKLLLEKNEGTNDFTSILFAAESGNLEMVNLLLSKGVNVNVRNYRKNSLPLHSAVINGHLNMVDFLIFSGTDINSRMLNGYTPLHYAVENGHVEIVNVLLEHGANVNITDRKHKFTPLHYAIKYGFKEIAFILLKNKASYDKASINGITPLHIAAHGGHLDIVDYLLEHSVNIHAKDKNNKTALHFAAMNGHKKIAKLLINKGVNVNSKSKDNRTPLHEAIEKGSYDIVKLLVVKHNANVRIQDMEGNAPLHLAAINGNVDIMKILINNKAEVNIKDKSGKTPLHYAAIFTEHIDAVDLLIKHKAKVNVTDKQGTSPLDAAVVKGNRDTVKLLIKNKADVNAGVDTTPLRIAVEQGHKEMVDILIASGADVNSTKGDESLLSSAVRINHKGIIKTLIRNGADVYTDYRPLILAVLCGYCDILELLLKNNANVNGKDDENYTPLHYAALVENKQILNSLLKWGANTDNTDNTGSTPLHIAAEIGNDDMAEILIKNKSKVNAVNSKGLTPLHQSLSNGHNNIVKLLFKNGAKINIKDKDGRTPLELAVVSGQLESVKIVLEHRKVDINAKGKEGTSLLHVAANEKNMKMIEFLIDKGCDINAKNMYGTKPIHSAAMEGGKDIVEFFLSKGISVNELGQLNKSLLFYAASQNQLDVVNYLLSVGADVNAEDDSGVTPLIVAAVSGHKDVVKVLVENGGIFENSDKLPFADLFDKFRGNEAVELLLLTDRLFKAVKGNRFLEVKQCIMDGAFVNAKNALGDSVLHFAVWRGYDEIVRILLQNGSNPNIIGKNKCTPIHYASKFSHYFILKDLLIHGAVYNSLSGAGKTPLFFATNRNIDNLLRLIDVAFKKVEENDHSVIDDINNILHITIVKAIMSARNQENRTLIVHAVKRGFSNIELLKQVWQPGVGRQLTDVSKHLQDENFIKSLEILKKALYTRIEMLGPDNPGTLDIVAQIGTVLFNQKIYQNALNMFYIIVEKYEETMGSLDKDTLLVRFMIAIIKRKEGKYDEALDLFLELYQQQKEVDYSSYSITLDAQFQILLILNDQGKYEEAITLSKGIFTRREEKLGKDNVDTISAQYELAKALYYQGVLYEESLEIFSDILEKLKRRGNELVFILKTLRYIALVLFKQKKFNKAVHYLQLVFDVQEKKFRKDALDLLTTRFHLAKMLCAQGKWNDALKLYTDGVDAAKLVLGSNHSFVLGLLEDIEVIKSVLKYLEFDDDCSNVGEENSDLQDGANTSDEGIDIQTWLNDILSDMAEVTENLRRVSIRSGENLSNDPTSMNLEMAMQREVAIFGSISTTSRTNNMMEKLLVEIDNGIHKTREKIMLFKREEPVVVTENTENKLLKSRKRKSE